ncbi:MAG TPA: GNAT family N-acetyltransferase [Blastocatellia bacterium]|nr:GNAT family N-acetyltransferase [Blastocatellia bacterium]
MSLATDQNGISLRPACADDEAFLIEVYASTRADELALTGWDEAQCAAFVTMQFAAQQRHYREHYPNQEQQVILERGVPIGRLWVGRLEDEIRILDITILPAYRGRNAGTEILRRLMAEAASAGKPLRIYVESFNPSQRLFERLGFAKSGQSGYSDLLEWRP